MQQLSVRLDGRDHAGHDVVATQQTSDFRLDAGPGAVSELSQQAPVKAGMQSQPFGNRQHDLPVRDRSGDFLRHVQRRQQSAFLMAHVHCYQRDGGGPGRKPLWPTLLGASLGHVQAWKTC